MNKKRIGIILDFAIPIALLALVTAACWIWPLDLEFQSRVFDAREGDWSNKDDQPWRTLYNYGTYPALALALSALLIFALSFGNGRWRRWRKASLFLVLCVILGPALLVNLTLKEQWGRPRPRDVQEFGGTYAYERPLEYDSSSPGKSFPCGHCSMAFVFMSGFLLLRRNKRMLAITVLTGSIIYGALMGAARMVQGGHFFSDVVWSAGVCYLSAALVFYLLGLHRGVLVEPPAKESKKRRFPIWVYIAAIILGLGALFGALLNTPYHEDLTYQAEVPRSEDYSEGKYSLRLEPGDHSITQNGNDITIKTKRDGFGLPGSAIKETTKESVESGEHYFQFKQRTSGLFIEMGHKTEASLPLPEKKTFVRVSQHGGSLKLAPALGNSTCKWKLELGGLKQLNLALPEGATVRIEWPGTLPESLNREFKKLAGDTPDVWQSGEGKPLIQMEFDFGEDSAPEVTLQ